MRGYDISNITFVRSEHGWIIMDCGSSKYTAAEALKLFRSKMGDARIVAIVISHAHVDHYGGIEGLIAPEDAADSSLPLDEQIASGKTAIIVPKGFTDAVMKENVFVGTAMKRRAFFQYGSMLPYGEQGRLSVGIGLTAVQTGVGYIAPTFEVADSIYETTIDGVTAIFQQTPGTESPAEMNTYFPDSKALWMAENCSGSMHNLYTLRGAEVRDANGWARYITEAQSLFPDAEVVFQAHNWPHWGKETVNEYMTNTAAIYKFIHDQTLLYINEGYTATEIASMIRLPEELEKVQKFYGELLGLPLVRSWGEPNIEGLMYGAGTSLIEIFPNAEEDLPQGAIRHFALATDDVDSIVETVRKAGYAVTMEPVDIEIMSKPSLPARIAFIIGPVGEEIELFCEKQ